MKKYRDILIRSGAILCVASLFNGQVFGGGLVDLDGGEFDDSSAMIDNPWWPLNFGDKWTYFKADGDECELIILEVLGTSGSVGETGTPVRIVSDNAYVNFGCGDDPNPFVLDGDYHLVESTLDWYAQDIAGNIWYIGEQTYSKNWDPDEEDYVAFEEEDCDFIGDESVAGDALICLDGNWEDGQNVLGDMGYEVDEVAERGIVMLANPGSGEFYAQETYPEIAEDMGKVLNFRDVHPFFIEELEDLGFDQEDFEKCLRTKEWNPLEPGAIEHKYYCYEIGLIQVEENGGGKTVWEDVLETNISPPTP